jgi:hypothetical protein
MDAATRSIYGNTISPPLIEEEHVDSLKFEQLQKLARYAQLSYCGRSHALANFEYSLSTRSVSNPTFSRGTCNICNEHISPLQVNRTILSNDRSMQGYAGVDTDSKIIYFSFQGAMTIPSWMRGLNIARKAVTFDGVKYGMVHSGLYYSYIHLRDTLFGVLLPLIEQYPMSEGYTIHGVGHSLGCPLTTFAVLDLVYRYRIDANKISLTSFGCPRFGNHAMSHSIIDNAGFANITRVVHSFDFMTKLGPLNMGYRHFGTLIIVFSISFLTRVNRNRVLDRPKVKTYVHV